MTQYVKLDDILELEIIEFKQFGDNINDRPEFRNKFLKLLYFIIYEGLISTLRKYFAQRGGQKQYLTFIFINYNQKKYVNISVQFTQESSSFVITNEFYITNDINYENISKNLNYYLSQFNQFAEIVNYEILGINVSNSVSFDFAPKFYKDKYTKGLFVYGLGAYVKMFIMHHFKKIPKIACVDYKLDVLEYFKTKYQFKHSCVLSSNTFQLLENVKHPIVIIAAFHSDHASLAYEVFKCNPNSFIFIEKPPTLTLEDLNKLVELYKCGAHLEIGFNRRHIAYNKYVRDKVINSVVYITISIKEVRISDNHWYLWENQGTRLSGNAVHWFDLANFWIESVPSEINLLASPNDCESSAISVLYKNGSILNITVTDKGNSLRGVQEKIEVRFGDETIFIDDYLSHTHINHNGIKIRKWKFNRNKGHNTMYKNFLNLVEKGGASEYRPYDLIRTSLLAYYSSKMLTSNTRNLNIEHEINHYLRIIDNSNKFTG